MVSATRVHRSGIALLAVAAALAMGIAACSKSSDSGWALLLAPRHQAAPAPAPDSPQSLLRLFEWCYDNRSIERYREPFTEDFGFVFSSLDPAGNAYRGSPWTREDELTYFSNLIQSATSITLVLDRNLIVLDDPRPGKGGRWHKKVRTSVTLSILAGGGQTTVTGFATFFAVRGDSASIPSDLIARGFQPDSTRWYIERWEDETSGLGSAYRATSTTRAGGAGTHRGQVAGAQPSKSTTWGTLKVLYHSEPAK